MTAPKTASTALTESPSCPSFWAAWVRFWFLPRATFGLHSIRVLFCLLVFLWLVPLAGDLQGLFGLDGWFDTQVISEAAGLVNSPIDTRSWSLLYLIGNDPTSLQAFFWGTLVVVLLFLLGICTRFTGVLSWLAVCSFSANPFIEADADAFLRMLAFYLMIGYLLIGQGDPHRSGLSRLIAPFDFFLFQKKPSASPLSSAATVALRLMQVHFALAIVILGLHKLQMAEWWGGVSLWYPLNHPSEVTRDSLQKWGLHRDYYLSLISIATYLVLAWQLAFPTFAWRVGRFLWLLLGGAVIGCFGSMFLYQIPVLGPVFLVCCFVYLTDDEWQRWSAPLVRLLGKAQVGS